MQGVEFQGLGNKACHNDGIIIRGTRGVGVGWGWHDLNPTTQTELITCGGD